MSRVEPAPSSAKKSVEHHDKEMQKAATNSSLCNIWGTHFANTSFSPATSGASNTTITRDFYQRLFTYIESGPGQSEGLYTSAHPTHMMLQLHDYHTIMIALCELHHTSPTISESRAHWQEFHHPIAPEDYHISQLANMRLKAEMLEERKEAYCVEHENAGFPYTGDLELNAFKWVMKGVPMQDWKAERAYQAAQRWRVQYERGGGMEEDWKIVRRWEAEEERKRKEKENAKHAESSAVVQSSRKLSYTGQEFVPQSVPKTMREVVSETYSEVKVELSRQS